MHGLTNLKISHTEYHEMFILSQLFWYWFCWHVRVM